MSAITDLSWANDHWMKYKELYRKYADYYNGKHKNYFESRDARNPNHKGLFERLEKLKDNMCKTVTDAITARLELSGMDSQEETIKNWLDDYFKTNRVVSLAKAVHRDVILYGDAYVLVSPPEKTEGTPLIVHERPYNVAVKYDYLGVPEMAVKWIVEKKTETESTSHYWIYTKDYIYKRTRPGSVAPGDCDFSHLDYSDATPDIKNPWGKIPVFHFFNGMRKDAFCRSDLGDVVPLQDALNESLKMRELAAYFNGWRQKWMAGVSIPMDEYGEPVASLKSSMDRIWTFDSSDVRVGEFSATDLNNYTNTISDLREEIARVSNVPFHVMGLGGNFPSGEALKTAEAPLIAKINNKQILFGNVWEDVFSFVLELAGKESKGITAEWKDTQPHSESEQWQIAADKLALGVSETQVLSEMGYTLKQIEEFQKDNNDPYKNMKGAE